MAVAIVVGKSYLLQLFYTDSVGDYLTGSTLPSADGLLLENGRKKQNMMSFLKYGGGETTTTGLNIIIVIYELVF